MIFVFIISDPNDYMISVLCMPEGWDLLPVGDLPECKAWCPAQKPSPPNNTGLTIRSNQVRYVCTYQYHLYRK